MPGRVPFYDAIVIGAGPAGSTTAYRMAKNGLRVLVLDKKPFPRDKLCGGLLTVKTVQLVKDLFGLSPGSLEGILPCRSRPYALYYRRRLLFSGRLRDFFYFTDRKRYDRFFLAQATEAGAEAVLKARVVGLRLSDGTVETAGHGRFRGRFIIGADGVSSRIRRALFPGTREDRQQAAALEADLPRGPGPSPADTPMLAFGYTPAGYAWIFPGPDRFRLGILSTKKTGSLRSDFSRFVEDHAMGKEASPRGGRLPYGGFLRRPGCRNVLLVGDAAGFADPLLGEGIFYAHRSAQIAAEAVLACWKQPWAALDRYAGTLQETILYEFRFARIWRGLLFGLGPVSGYRIVAAVMRGFQKPCEAVIQGRRSFNWIRSTNRAVP